LASEGLGGSAMKRILREPLLHFLLMGAAIFAVYSWMPRRLISPRDSIVVTQGQIASMAESFARTWQRPPSPSELDGLIEDRVREEVYSREALALGLDRDDTIIRRRLRQKMEFISEDVAAEVAPTDAELEAYLEAHPDTFRMPALVSFRHVYLNPEKHRDDLARDAARLLARLSQADGSTDVSSLGDSFLLDHTFCAVSAREVAGQFGGRFAATLGEIPLGRWQGPIESSYGMHLVLVSERTEDRLPALAEVRDAVRREWANARRVDANAKAYEAMLQGYVVVIERPPAARAQ
jgi:hypothetical protein